MKLKRLLMTTMPIIGTAALVTPIVASCGDLKPVELSNQDVGGGKVFGISGNFNKDTKYEFVANLSKWNATDTPTEEEWKKDLTLVFTIKVSDQSEIKFKNFDQIKIICDGKELVKDQQWHYETEQNMHCFEIDTKNQSPVKKTSVVKLQYIQFEGDQKDLMVHFVRFD